MSTYNAKQIEHLKNTAVRSLVGDSGQYNISADGVVEYLAGTTAKTDSQITTEMTRIQGVYDGLAYQRTRGAAYAELKEQLDLLYHDMTAGKLDATGEWHKAIKAVKDATPKP